jgi:hypothetical protein
MALISYMLGGLHSSSSPTHKHQRKRLRKAPPKAKSTPNLYSCKEIVDEVRAQSTLVLFKSDGNLTITELPDSEYETSRSRPEIGFLFDNPQANASRTSMRNYSADEMDPEFLKRARAKTPVFAIGQLEKASMFIDKAQALAEQYQSLLPPRTFTPYPLNLPDLAPKKLQRLRKIKCQLDLRDSIKEDPNRGHSVAYSDAETLVGSESPSPPPSPTETEDHFDEANLIIDPHDQSSADPMAIFENDIGLKICVDLLTTELATALFRQHPAERGDRASGLQILLMIEAYEAIQKNVRQQLCDPHVTQEMADHVKSVDRILRYWLKVLYSVYDQSQEIKGKKKVGDEEWEMCDSPKELHCAVEGCQR